MVPLPMVEIVSEACLLTFCDIVRHEGCCVSSEGFGWIGSPRCWVAAPNMAAVCLAGTGSGRHVPGMRHILS
mgnify:CR=1 FL=1